MSDWFSVKTDFFFKSSSLPDLGVLVIERGEHRPDRLLDVLLLQVWTQSDLCERAILGLLEILNYELECESQNRARFKTENHVNNRTATDAKPITPPFREFGMVDVARSERHLMIESMSWNSRENLAFFTVFSISPTWESGTMVSSD